ncbi:MAG: Hsp20/alpha crystallin family protein [Anaerolineales bacterium]|nr:Hsp20/alpha crystallin family protein [Anaerolineales bacterium]
MSLTIRPFYRPGRLTEIMDRLFDEAFNRTWGSFPTVDGFSIPVDILAKDDEYIVYANVPGLRAEDLNVEVLGNSVTLRGEIFAPASEEKNNWLLQERVVGKFSRSFTLPAELDNTKAEANLENGVLTLRLPKAEAARPKSIKVRVK